jgi:hypothetical protein
MEYEDKNCDGKWLINNELILGVFSVHHVNVVATQAFESAEPRFEGDAMVGADVKRTESCVL